MARISITCVACLAVLAGCSHPPAEPAGRTSAQKLPFDRAPRSGGVSPTQSLVPTSTRLPEGTPIPVRLRSEVSSATARAGDAFAAVVDEPLAVEGQILVAAGAEATGRVLEAKSSKGAAGAGYLRVVLVSLMVGGKPVAIETSSIFVKGGSHEERRAQGDAVLSADRHLSFRLAQNAELP